MAKEETTEAGTAKGASPIVLAGVLLCLTGVGVGIGWLTGDMLGTRAETAANTAGARQEAPAQAENPSVLPLEAITTNLAPPADVWARMEASLIFEAAPDEAIALAVHQDLLAYIRTVKAHQIKGASAFQHFKADLEDIAATRSEGKVKGVLIRTLLFE